MYRTEGQTLTPDLYPSRGEFTHGILVAKIPANENMFMHLSREVLAPSTLISANPFQIYGTEAKMFAPNLPRVTIPLKAFIILGQFKITDV